MTDVLLRRITFEPDRSSYVRPGDIDWPPGLAPIVLDQPQIGDLPLAPADVVVIAYTSAEGQATADVLSPGLQRPNWGKYTHNMVDVFDSHFTWKSPARAAGCLADVAYVKIGEKVVCLVRSNCHWSTDDATIPVMRLVQQIATETGAEDLIDTGTAGGRDPQQLGDVVVALNVKLDATGSQWAAEPWAQRSFPAVQPSQACVERGVGLVPQAVIARLKASGYTTRAPRAVFGRDILTVPIFAYADDDDSFGLARNDPNFGAEEMDAGAVALALTEMANPPRFIAIRNCSDPQMKDGSVTSRKLAEDIYEKTGYDDTIVSSLAVWGAIIGL